MPVLVAKLPNEEDEIKVSISSWLFSSSSSFSNFFPKGIVHYFCLKLPLKRNKTKIFYIYTTFEQIKTKTRVKGLTQPLSLFAWFLVILSQFLSNHLWKYFPTWALLTEKINFYTFFKEARKYISLLVFLWCQPTTEIMKSAQFAPPSYTNSSDLA